MSSAFEVSTAEFLDWLWPDDGIKVITAFRDLARPPRQHFCQSTSEAAKFIEAADGLEMEVYHACAVYKTAGSRKADNALGAAAFWLDVDCGPAKPYPDAGAGYRALGQFVERAGLPVPLVVASGSGLHVYWALDRLLDPARWLAGAQGLRALCDTLDFAADPSRTADLASILRPVGTRNRKYGVPLWVRCGPLPDYADAEGLLRTLSGRRDHDAGDRGQQWNLNAAASEGLRPGGDPPSMTTGYAEGGRTTELTKRAGWCLGPWHMTPDAAVAACLAWNQHNRPPIDTSEVETTVLNIFRLEEEKNQHVSILPTEVLPTPTHPFYLSAHKQLMLNVKDLKTDEYAPVVVYKAPLYVLGYRRTESAETRTIALRHWLPHDGWLDVVVPWDDTSFKTVGTRLTAHGLNLYPQQVPHVVRYIQNSIDHMQNNRATDLEFEQMGWKGSAFLLGNELWQEGNSVPVGVGNEARQRAAMLTPKGTYNDWAAAANKLFEKGFEGQAFMLIASFAAPLMRFRLDVGGVIVSAVSQESGTGKTTGIEAAASVWGDRSAIDINSADTQNSRFRSIALLANLPVVFDELRNRDPEVVKSFILSFTDGRDKNRLNQDGTLKRLNSGWSTILISASNLSLAETVSYDNEAAQAARVLEYRAELPPNVEAADGKAMQKVFRANRGNAGRLFLENLCRRDVLEWVAKATDQYDRDFAKQIGSQTETRFYSSLLACVKAASMLLTRWGMLEFDWQRVTDFGLAAATDMRVQIGSNRMSPTDILTTFINEHWHTCLSVQDAVAPRQEAQVRQSPRSGFLYMRHEDKPGVLLIDRNWLKRWCVKNKFMMLQLQRDLQKIGVLKSHDTKRNLGAGTPYAAGGNTACWIIDTHHPAIGLPRLVSGKMEDVA